MISVKLCLSSVVVVVVRLRCLVGRQVRRGFGLDRGEDG
jgi:hypothetical protein